MGSIFSPNNSCLFVGYLEDKFIGHNNSSPIIYVCVKYMFLIWKGPLNVFDLSH